VKKNRRDGRNGRRPVGCHYFALAEMLGSESETYRLCGRPNNFTPAALAIAERWQRTLLPFIAVHYLSADFVMLVKRKLNG